MNAKEDEQFLFVAKFFCLLESLDSLNNRHLPVRKITLRLAHRLPVENTRIPFLDVWRKMKQKKSTHNGRRFRAVKSLSERRKQLQTLAQLHPVNLVFINYPHLSSAALRSRHLLKKEP